METKTMEDKVFDIISAIVEEWKFINANKLPNEAEEIICALVREELERRENPELAKFKEAVRPFISIVCNEGYKVANDRDVPLSPEFYKALRSIRDIAMRANS